jgi:general secretion pathway protein L
LKTTLRLELPTLQELTAASRIAFALLDRQHNLLRAGELALSEIAASVPSSRVEAILHPGDTIVTSVIVPPLPPHRMSAAVAGAVEPMLLGDIETLALAHGPRNPDGSVAVAWGPRDAIARAMHTLAHCGLAADALLPAPLVLALPASGWIAMEHGGQLVVRSGTQSGYCWTIDPYAHADGTEPAAAALLLAIEQENPPAISWVEPQPIWWQPPLGIETHVLPAAARWTGIAPTWSLALPDLRPRNSGRTRWQRPLAWSAAAAAVWLVGLNVHAWQLKREENALRLSMVAQVKAAFPDLPVIVDPLKQAEQRRDALRSADGKFGDSDFLPLSLAVAQVLPQASSNLKTLSFAEAELRMKLVDDSIGMTGATPPSASKPASTGRQIVLQRNTPATNADANRTANSQAAAIDPAIVQRAQGLGLAVDKVDGEWRFRMGSAGPGVRSTPTSANRLRIENGGTSR